MAKVKINQKILILKQDVKINKKLKFDAGTEFEIVSDVVYMGGFPVPPQLQLTFFKWLLNNMTNSQLFKEDFRRFK